MLLLFALILAQVSTPVPAATPSATPSPAPAVTVTADFSLYALHTGNPSGSLGDIGSGLVTANATFGDWKISATAGDYGFPALGFALTPDTQPGTNEQLYTALPLASLTYTVNSHLSLAAGKFAALLGQESPFTFQNINIERGVGWSMEPAISRGVQLAYTNGPLTMTLQDNDGYYSGRNRAFEGLLSWAPTAQSTWQFAAIVSPRDTPPNPTTTIANKSEYDFMYTYKTGKLQFLPYFLYVYSPTSAVLGYTNSEYAAAAVAMGTWTFSPQLSVAARYENAWNGSSTADVSPNADLIGFGAGSKVQTFTVTPALHFGNSGVLRLEYSWITPLAQSRIGAEFGVFQ